jgi:phage shock protein A
MSISRRVRDITLATLHDRLENAEDPVRMIDEFLRSSREQIASAEQLYRQCLKHAENMRNQYLSAAEMVERREQQAAVALKACEEGIARLALQEKLMYEEKAEQYKELYEKAKASLTELEEQLQELKTEYDEVLSKRQYYAARMESIRLQRQMNERLRALGSERVTEGAFRRLEDRITELELEGRSLRDLRRMTKESLYQAGSAVKATLELELENLRRKLEKEGLS